jgi:TM2 domain-containing membrane protein YozV
MTSTNEYCGNCGAPLEVDARFCGECGATVEHQAAQNRTSSAQKEPPERRGAEKRSFLSGDNQKDKATVTLLGLFLGGFGIHKFYMGSWGWGVVYLLTCWLPFPYLAGLAETVRYILMTDDEFREKAEKFTTRGPFGFFW